MTESVIRIVSVSTRASFFKRCAVALTLGVIAATIGIVTSREVSSADSTAPALTSASAVAVCNGQVGKYSGMSASDTPLELTGAYSSTAGLVTTWDENRPGQIGPNSDFSGWSSSELVSVCYFSGDFTGFPGPPGSPTAYYTIVVVVQTNGSSTLDFAGPANLGFSPPQSVSN